MRVSGFLASGDPYTDGGILICIGTAAISMWTPHTYKDGPSTYEARRGVYKHPKARQVH